MAKDDDNDRLIYDWRPLNHLERRFAWVSLPSAAQLQRIILAPDEGVRGSGDDLRGFYSQLRHEDN